MGKVNNKPISNHMCLLVLCPGKLGLNNDIKKFWELENIPEKPHILRVDLHCEEIYNKTTFRDKTGCFIVSLLFKILDPHVNWLTIGSFR